MNQLDSEQIISRLCDADATAACWAAFQVQAQLKPELWRMLAEAQRDHALVSAAVTRATDLADSIDLPIDDALLLSARRGCELARSADAVAGQLWVQAVPRTHDVAAPWRSWAGWAVAAGVALTWALAWNASAPNLGRPERLAADRPMPSSAGFGNASPQEVLQTYLDKGRESGLVLGEIPTKVLLEARPSPTGSGYDLLYLRQVLERTFVPDLYQFDGEDERGQPTLVRLDRVPDRPM